MSLSLLLLNSFSDLPCLSRKDVKPLDSPTPTFVPASALFPQVSKHFSPPPLSRHPGHLAQKALLCSSHYFESLCRCPLLQEVFPASPRFHLDSGNSLFSDMLSTVRRGCPHLLVGLSSLPGWELPEGRLRPLDSFIRHPNSLITVCDKDK